MIPLTPDEKDQDMLRSMRMLVGHTVTSVDYHESHGQEYVRWTFSNGAYSEWHTSLYGSTVKGTHAASPVSA